MDILSANQMMWTAFIIAHITPLAFIALYYFKYISKEIFSLYFIGVLVGLTWEIPFSLAGKSFHLILIDWPIDLPLVRNIAYSFIDGLIFIIGVYLSKLTLMIAVRGAASKTPIIPHIMPQKIKDKIIKAVRR